MPSLPNPELSRAILIGTSDFLYDELKPLPAVRNNLIDLLKALTDPDTGILTDEQCTTIETPETQRSFMSRLRKPARQAEDLLLIYYAGHGIRYDRLDQLFLTVRETDPAEPTDSAVSFELIRQLIEDSAARTRLLILDCCYSGMAVSAMSAPTLDLSAIRVAGTSVIASSPRNQISHSPPGERNTAFTAELLSLLVNGSRLPGEQLTVDALFRSLEVSMAMRSLPMPKRQSSGTSNDLLLRRTPLPKAVPPKPVPLPVVAPTPKPVAPPPIAVPKPGPVAAAKPPKVDPPKPPVYVPPVQYKPQPVPVSFAYPPVDPPTVRTQPVSRPSVAFPDMSKLVPAIDGKQLAAKALTGTKWTASKVLTLMLSVCLYVGGGFTVGGLIGTIFASPLPGGGSSGDLSMAAGASLFALISGLVVYLRWRRARRRKVGRTSLVDVFPDLGDAVGKSKTVTLWIALGISLVVATVGSFTEPVTTSSATTAVHTSSLSTTASMVTIFLAIGATCGFALVKRYRPRPVEEQVSQPGLELNG